MRQSLFVGIYGERRLRSGLFYASRICLYEGRKMELTGVFDANGGNRVCLYVGRMYQRSRNVC